MRGVNFMKYLIAIWVIIVLIGLLFIALINLEDYGISGYILAGVSAYALYKIFKLMFFGWNPDETDDDNAKIISSHESLDPLEYIIYDNLPDECDE